MLGTSFDGEPRLRKVLFSLFLIRDRENIVKVRDGDFSEVIISTDNRYRNIDFQTGITVKLKLFLIIVGAMKGTRKLFRKVAKMQNEEKNLHAENRSTTSYIQNDLIFEKVGVLIDGILVRICPHFIFLARVRC